MTLPDGVAHRDFGRGETLATRGDPVYGERTMAEWREWEVHRSKLGTVLDRGADTGLAAGDTVLYLGAAAGTTVSHVADFAGPTYAVEFAARPARDLLDVARSRSNVIPLLKDARSPDSYAHIVEADVDAIIQDVATRGQATVAVENRRFLADDGTLILAIKARSEDVTEPPASVYDAVLETLREAYSIDSTHRLDPVHADHLAVVATPRPP